MGDPVVFIDRDGVICEEKGFLSSHDELELINGSAEAIKLLNDQNYTVIVITNQPVVARGICSEEDIEFIHIHLNELVRIKSNGFIDSFYFCPHHPKVGEDPLYTRDCDCRKPKPGMIIKAAKDFGIKDLGSCFMVGDKIGDVKAGRDAGCKTILVQTGYGGKEGWNDAKPDYTSINLLNAIREVILKE